MVKCKLWYPQEKVKLIMNEYGIQLKRGLFDIAFLYNIDNAILITSNEEMLELKGKEIELLEYLGFIVMTYDEYTNEWYK